MSEKKIKTFTEEEKAQILKSFQITQDISEINPDKNFVCPCCRTKRIAKGKKSLDWKHTGCVCTYNYLELTNNLIRD